MFLLDQRRPLQPTISRMPAVQMVGNSQKSRVCVACPACTTVCAVSDTAFTRGGETSGREIRTSGDAEEHDEQNAYPFRRHVAVRIAVEVGVAGARCVGLGMDAVAEGAEGVPWSSMTSTDVVGQGTG